MGHIPRKRGRLSGDIAGNSTHENRCAPKEKAKSGQVHRKENADLSIAIARANCSPAQFLSMAIIDEWISVPIVLY
jgi:hypothetical protein